MENPKPKMLITIALSIAFAAILANLLTPVIYRTLPSDYERTKLILTSLSADQDSNPDILLFGNSILMSGIDARLLSQQLPESPLAYNLSSSGQTLTESMLFYELLPSSVTRVVQFIRAEQLTQEPQALSDETAGNLFMYGYSPGPVTRTLLSEEHLHYFNKPQWKANYDARTIIPNSINRSIRGLLRKDLNLESVGKELYFPSVYQNRLGEQQYSKMITRFNPEQPIERFIPNESVIESLKEAAIILQKRNIQYIVVIHPINPGLSNFTTQYRAEVEQFIQLQQGQSTQWISSISMLDEIDFVDHWHVTREGAAKLTKQVAAKIK